MTFLSRKSLVSGIPASSAATRLIHWAQLGHFASSVDPKKGAERLFQIKLPNKSTGGCFAAAALTKLCPIKPDRIYAVPGSSCYNSKLATGGPQPAAAILARETALAPMHCR